MTPLTSIIIPTFNRGHLIEETIASILAQTYTNWECIIVDDRGTDDTETIIQSYIEKDNRMKYFKRPNSKPKGANACRNFGLKSSKGDVIVFFDSDDLMTPDHIETKVNALLEGNYDYVITRTQFFNASNTEIDKNYKFKIHSITAKNYITQKINWLTLDVAIKSILAKKISFNESLQSGQEYNYFSKLVLHSVNTIFIDKVVSLRRKHEGSVRANINSKAKFYRSHFKSFWYTYLDTKNMVSKDIRFHWLRTCVNYVYELKEIPLKSKRFFYLGVFREFRMKGIYFVLMMISLETIKKGYVFKRYLFK